MENKGGALKQAWGRLKPGQQRTLVALGVVLLVFGFVYMAASGKVEQRKALIKANQKAEPDKPLLFDGDTLERDLYDRLQTELEKKSRQLEETREETRRQNARMEEMLSRLSYLTEQAQRKSTGAPTRIERPKPPAEEAGDKLSPLGGKIEIPPPPPPPSAEEIRQAHRGESVFSNPLPSGKAGAGAGEDVEEVVGGIGVATTDEPDTPEPEDSKKNNSIHLAPSFMEAVLLSGMDAPIAGDAMQNPKPTMLRIAAPAVLPNRVKANLKGCFVVASGYGSLAEERLNLRLISLSCVARNGTAVIEEKIKGYVVDSDGKVGLHARVYMKAGPLLMRQFVAGVAEGVANVVTQGAMTTSVSALGTTQALDPGKTAQAGVATGFGSAAGSLSEFYKKLSEQTLPTLEVGPKKKVTVVLTEGVDLRIRDNCEDCADEI